MGREPLIAAFLNQLASFGRLVLFDKRGMGMSDPVVVDECSSVDEWIADIAAVMSATGSERAAIVGFGAGGPLSILFAATHPEAVTALVLRDVSARFATSSGSRGPSLESAQSDHESLS